MELIALTLLHTPIGAIVAAPFLLLGASEVGKIGYAAIQSRDWITAASALTWLSMTASCLIPA